MMLYLLALAIALGLGALTGPGRRPGGSLYALFLAFDGFDYPLARRGLSFSGNGNICFPTLRRPWDIVSARACSIWYR